MKTFKIGAVVNIDDCYLNDEVGQWSNATKTAIIQSEPTDDEELVCVEYENGVIDYIPQDVIN